MLWSRLLQGSIKAAISRQANHLLQGIVSLSRSLSQLLLQSNIELLYTEFRIQSNSNFYRCWNESMTRIKTILGKTRIRRTRLQLWQLNTIQLQRGNHLRHSTIVTDFKRLSSKMMKFIFDIWRWVSFNSIWWCKKYEFFFKVYRSCNVERFIRYFLLNRWSYCDQ